MRPYLVTTGPLNLVGLLSTMRYLLSYIVSMNDAVLLSTSRLLDDKRLARSSFDSKSRLESLIEVKNCSRSKLDKGQFIKTCCSSPTTSMAQNLHFRSDLGIGGLL